MSDNVKSAMSPENEAMLSKYLKMGLGAALVTAGVGAVIRNNRAKKEHKKDTDATGNMNSIVIPVKKVKFMEGLPTPEALAASRGETGTVEGESKQENAPSGEKKEMTAEEIAEVKKRVLGSNGRRVDFFRKAAAEEDDGSGNEEHQKVDVKKVVQKIVKHDNPDHKKEKREISSDGKLLPPRDESGKFVSPTDPVGVISQEKFATWDWAESGKNLALHPFKTIGGAFEAGSSRPIFITAAGIGGYYLATMLVDKINAIRAKKAKGDADVARAKYVKLIQEADDSEKTASERGFRDTDNPFVASGTLLGGSFVIPMAISAIIANKIMERRREEKKKKSLASDSFPDEPIVVYKTASNEEIRISPESALAMISIKRAMIEAAERSNWSDGNVKSAASASDVALLWNLGNKMSGIVPKGYSLSNPEQAAELSAPMTSEEAYDLMMTQLENVKNNQHLASIIKSPGNKQNMVNALWAASATMDPVKRYRFWTGMINPTKAGEKFRNEFKDRMTSEERTQQLFLNRMNDPAFADTFDPIIAGHVDNYLTDKTNGWGLDKDGVLFKIISWILNNTGLGKYFAKRQMNKMFYGNRAKLKEMAAQAAKKKQEDSNQAANNKQESGSQVQNPNPEQQAGQGKPVSKVTPSAPAAVAPAEAPAKAPAEAPAKATSEAPASDANPTYSAWIRKIQSHDSPRSDALRTFGLADYVSPTNGVRRLERGFDVKGVMGDADKRIGEMIAKAREEGYDVGGGRTAGVTPPLRKSRQETSGRTILPAGLFSVKKNVQTPANNVQSAPKGGGVKRPASPISWFK